MKDITVNTLQVYVGMWAYSTFPGATSKSIVAHLKKEVAELDSAIESNEHADIAEESADCLLLLYHLAHKNNFSLILEAEKKMAGNEKRTWGPPDKDGVREHIEDRPSVGGERANGTGEDAPCNNAKAAINEAEA